MKYPELNEENYEPCITCPFCHHGGASTPTEQLWYSGWALQITRTCPACDATWVERWQLATVELDQ